MKCFDLCVAMPAVIATYKYDSAQVQKKIEQLNIVAHI